MFLLFAAELVACDRNNVIDKSEDCPNATYKIAFSLQSNIFLFVSRILT